MPFSQGSESPVEIRVDDARRRIFVTIRGAVGGQRVGGPVAAAFATRNELTGYDMLYDIRAYTGDVGADDVKPIVEAYASASPDPSIPVRTAFLTLDPNFQLWAEAMNYQFPGRTHRAFPDAESGEAWLDEPMDQRGG